MEVIKFLKANGNNFQKLIEVYGIKVKDYPEQKLAVQDVAKLIHNGGYNVQK